MRCTEPEILLSPLPMTPPVAPLRPRSHYNHAPPPAPPHGIRRPIHLPRSLHPATYPRPPHLRLHRLTTTRAPPSHAFASHSETAPTSTNRVSSRYAPSRRPFPPPVQLPRRPSINVLITTLPSSGPAFPTIAHASAILPRRSQPRKHAPHITAKNPARLIAAPLSHSIAAARTPPPLHLRRNRPIQLALFFRNTVVKHHPDPAT